jgi:hypothetical protein
MQVSKDRDLVGAPREEEIAPALLRRQRLAHPTGDLLGYAFGALTVVVRLVPFIPNLVPVGALALFSGARMRSWRAYVLPVAVMALADVGLYVLHGRRPFDPFVYGSFLLSVLMGRLLARTNSPLWIGGMAVLSSLQFFLITNFGCWLITMPEYYARSFGGLVECYVKALPFYRGTFVGDLAYSALFFGIYAAVTSAERAKAAAAEETA